MTQMAPAHKTVYSAAKPAPVTPPVETTLAATPSGKIRNDGRVTLPQREVAILVMGVTGSGKTSFINLASGSTLRVGSGLESCTSIVQTSLPFELDGRTITLIDTPGFDDTNKSDTDILKMITVFLASSYERRENLVGIIYVHRMSDFRMGGSSSRNFKMFRHLCGDSALVNVAIVTNMWGAIDREVGETREEELVTKDIFFKPVLQLGAKMIRNDNTLQSTCAIMRLLINNRPQTLRIQREIVEEHKDISQTAAGQELNRELMEQDKRNREELEKVQEEMDLAIDENDQETRRELEVEQLRLQAEIAKVQSETQNLATSYNEEKARVARKMQEVAEAAQRESTRAAEQQREVQKYRDQVQLNASAAAAEEAKIAKLRVATEAMSHSFEHTHGHEPRGLPVGANVQRSADRERWGSPYHEQLPDTPARPLILVGQTELCQPDLTNGSIQGPYDSRSRYVGPCYPENAELLRQLTAAQACTTEMQVQSESDGIFTSLGRALDCLIGSRRNSGREKASGLEIVYEDGPRTARHSSRSKYRRK